MDAFASYECSAPVPAGAGCFDRHRGTRSADTPIGIRPALNCRKAHGPARDHSCQAGIFQSGGEPMKEPQLVRRWVIAMEKGGRD